MFNRYIIDECGCQVSLDKVPNYHLVILETQNGNFIGVEVLTADGEVTGTFDLHQDPIR